MNTIELKNYAFTIQIPAFKKINYKGVYQPYKELSELEQEDFIYSIVRNALSCNDNQHFEVKFEKHKDGRVHAHGTLYQLTLDQLDEFTDSICYMIGVKSPKQRKECCFCIPILLSYGWELYINKDQEPERDFSKYLFGKLNK